MAARTDPAVDAWHKVKRAREDDDKYLAAVVEFERVVPTTERGVKLKLKLLASRDRTLAQGDTLTWRGCLHRKRYETTIDQALTALTAGEGPDRQAWIRPGTTPTPRHPPARRRPKSVEGLS